MTETAPLRSLALCGGLVALFLGAAMPAAAQNAPASKDLDAVRKAMSGIWTGYTERAPGPPPTGPNSTINDRRFPPALEAIMLPWVRSGYDKYKKAAENIVDKEPPTPDNHCLPFAMPGEGPSSGFGLQFLFTPRVTGMIIQLDTQFRLIHMDQEHPKDLKPSWHGHSVGHWEGDTLVVDTVGYDERSDFSDGVLHSAQLHSVERYRMTDDGHLEMTVTYTDPGAFTKPYTIVKKWKHDEPFQEYLNAQNNKLYPCPTAEGGSVYKPFR